MPLAMGTEPLFRPGERRAGNSVAHEEREDALIHKPLTRACVFIQVYGYFFCGPGSQHSGKLSSYRASSIICSHSFSASGSGASSCWRIQIPSELARKIRPRFSSRAIAVTPLNSCSTMGCKRSAKLKMRNVCGAGEEDCWFNISASAASPATATKLSGRLAGLDMSANNDGWLLFVMSIKVTAVPD